MKLLLSPRLHYVAAWLMYALILILGCVPGARADLGQLAPGYLLHALAYGSLTCLLFSGGKGTPATRAAKAVLIVALMGALDEFVQTFVPYRSGKLSDWAFDVAVSLATAGLLWHRARAASGTNPIQ